MSGEPIRDQGKDSEAEKDADSNNEGTDGN